MRSASSRGGLPGIAVRRPVTVAMSLLALVVVGVIAHREIQVQLLPSGFTPPRMWVEVPTLPGAPADNERTVAEPLEVAFATLPQLAEMETEVGSDSVSFELEFEDATDVAAAADQVRDRLDRTAPHLPDGAQYAFIWRHDPTDEPVYILGLTWKEMGDGATADDIYEKLRLDLVRPLERVPGVSRAMLRGIQPRKVRIEVDDGAARAHGIDPGELVQRLRRDNFTLAAGALQEAGRRVLVRSVSRFEDLETVRAVPLADGVVVGDVARVFFGPDPEVEFHRIDGGPAATLMVFKESTANTVEVCAAAAATVAERVASDPDLAGLGLHPFFDQGHHITSSIDELQISSLYGAAIAVFFLFLFLRSVGLTLFVTLAIPLCLLSVVIVLYFKGDSLNVMSMMGLMLSVGMVVDNAIVVMENVVRLRGLGQDPIAASINGAGEVALAITLATMTSMVVFLPLILLNESPGLAFFLGKIGFPVCYALAASLFVALVYIPCGARFLRSGRSSGGGLLFDGLRRGYAGALAFVLSHRRGSALVVLVILVSAAWPAGKIRRVDRIDANLDSINIHVKGPPNGNREELDATVQGLESRLLEQREALEMRTMLTRTGWSREHVMVQVFFHPPAQRKLTREQATKAIRKLLPERPGFEARIGWGGGGGSNQEGGVNLKITGPDTALATELAKEVAHSLRALPGVESAGLAENETGSELRFRVARDVADRAGLSPLQIGGTIDYSLRGRRLENFHTAGREVEMVVELAQADREDVEQVGHLAVRSLEAGADASGTPLGLVTHAERSPGYGKITREDRRTAVEIQVMGDDEKLFGALEGALSQVRLPPGYAVDFGDRFRKRYQNEEGGAYAIVVAMALVFFLMGVLFESFLLPFSILLSIPLAFCGVVWTLWLTDTPLDIMAIIGCIILVGVVVNNGIVLIDQVQQRRRDGLTRTEALLEAAHHRVRPVLMTALTTIGGLVPMAVGKAALLGIEYQPLGRVVIGGLLTGTFLTLFAVPLFYTLLDDLRLLPAKVRLVFGRRPPTVNEPSVAD